MIIEKRALPRRQRRTLLPQRKRRRQKLRLPRKFQKNRETQSRLQPALAFPTLRHPRCSPRQPRFLLMPTLSSAGNATSTGTARPKIAPAPNPACARRRRMETPRPKPFSEPCTPPATALAVICLPLIAGLPVRCTRSRRILASRPICKCCGGK